MNLEFLGAGADVRAAFAVFGARGLVLARVATAQRDQYRLYAEAGELDAEPAGVLWYRTGGGAGMPLVGDWVAAREVGPGQAIVEEVLPRRTLFSRRAAGSKEAEQGIAANIDRVFLVCGLDGDFNLRRLERYLTLAAESGAEPVVVLNKADLCDDVPARVEAAAAVAAGAPVIACSAQEEQGIGALLSLAGAGHTVALLGSSGVGKSTIVNRLLGEERFRTSEVRESDSRGRHTTTHRELVALPGGGALIDTPGMRELQLWASRESVDAAFDEIVVLAGQCRFRDCSHVAERGCAVKAAMENGLLSAERWESYRKLRGEAEWHEALADPLAGQERKRRIKVIHRAQRRHNKLNR